MNTLVTLPEGVTHEQKEIYNKNCELYTLAFENRNRYGAMFSLCCDLGSQDMVFLDKNLFINRFPYNNSWYKLAYGVSFNNEPDFTIRE